MGATWITKEIKSRAKFTSLHSEEQTTWKEKMMGYYRTPEAAGQQWANYGLWAKSSHSHFISYWLWMLSTSSLSRARDPITCKAKNTYYSWGSGHTTQNIALEHIKYFKLSEFEEMIEARNSLSALPTSFVLCP